MSRISLIEAFAGIGTQHMALKKVYKEIDLIGISEIDKFALKSYELIHGKTHNFGDITKIDKLPYADIVTYSFPCQDLSLANSAGKGLEGSRSGLVYDFLEVIKRSPKPKVLLMENVRALVNKNHIDGFKGIQDVLTDMGYTNYWEILNAKDYGIPQNRQRVFMVSILGDHKPFEFPKEIELQSKLRDYLEIEVDESYYLSDKQIKQISNWKSYSKPLDNARTHDSETLQTITAKSNTSMNASMILIKEATKKGFKEAYEGDGIYINRPHQKRGVVQTDSIPTLKTNNNDLGVVVRVAEQRTDEGLRSFARLGIRKLTEREAWGLMGIDNKHFNKVKDELSMTQLYKQAGNAIVVSVLVAIFKKIKESIT